ncbi:hypothetical protein EHW65_20800 [Erwinia psidii]|uniref:hypothetical protein n=1 Tax=Erwinia psidii TaxID=69224 RepID=UPI00226B784E|nr:hypothetical protein [Erwinia psidii]MCX8959584.1 hypothetical protein [Erwinia psidii]
MNVINYQKKKVLIHDGLEDIFLKDGKTIPCPYCEGSVNFSLYNSLDFDRINEDKKMKMVKKMRGVKSTDDEVRMFKYKESSLILSESKCSHGLHDFSVVFTYREIQPARYESYLIGVFNNNDL